MDPEGEVFQDMSRDIKNDTPAIGLEKCGSAALLAALSRKPKVPFQWELHEYF